MKWNDKTSCKTVNDKTKRDILKHAGASCPHKSNPGLWEVTGSPGWEKMTYVLSLHHSEARFKTLIRQTSPTCLLLDLWVTCVCIRVHACMCAFAREHTCTLFCAVWMVAKIWVWVRSPSSGFAVCMCVCVWVCVFCHRVVSAALIAVYLVCGLTQSLAVRSATDSSVFIGSLWPYQH